ncbi:MAG TPA: glycosyl hydrolase family 28 protein [Polyangiaceae bacterium]|nr:glycosyl hydrolase family 28 protein [Polyangiaceae bacterium]
MTLRSCFGLLLLLVSFGCSSNESSTGGSNGTHGGASGIAGAATVGSGGTTSAGGAAQATGGGGTADASHAGGVGASGGAAPGSGGGSGSSAISGGGMPNGGTLGVSGGGAGVPATGGAAGSGAGMTSAAGMAGLGGAGPSGPPTCVVVPTLPGATASPLYTVTVGGAPLFVEKLTKFSPEMQVHYAHCTLTGAGSAQIAVTVGEDFNAYSVSPKSRNLQTSKSGRTVSFASGPNYLILQFDTKELLFILIDEPEVNPPALGDANVKNLADYGVDATGATLVTSKIQAAIDAASGATQNILYVPPGKYLIGELWLKSDMTLYLAAGAVLYGSSNTADFNTGDGGIDIEDTQHALIRMYQLKNTKILGRGVLDANGHAIRAAGLNANLLKIEQSSNILVDGIVSRDPSYWNTLVYRSDQVTIQNYKVINCRPTTGSTVYNQTDGVDFDESTNGLLSNAFLYTGDDGMATKNEEASGTINTKNVTHQHIVAYNNSVGCKIGTKSEGQSIDSVTFEDVDIVKAGRAMTIEAYDTAVVSNTTFQDIRVEAADSMLINLALDMPPTWRTAADTGVYKDTYFTNVSSAVNEVISFHGESASVDITGVHFKNFTVLGKPITSQTDPDATWDINSFVSGITFE